MRDWCRGVGLWRTVLGACACRTPRNHAGLTLCYKVAHRPFKASTHMHRHSLLFFILCSGETATAALIHVVGPVPRGECGNVSQRAVGTCAARRCEGGWRLDPKGKGQGTGGTAAGSRTQNGVYWVVGYSTGAVAVSVLPSGELLLRLEDLRAAVLSLLWVEGEDLLVAGTVKLCWDA